MSGVLDYLARLLGAAAFWFVVLPWQQALRVRCGRWVRLVGPGIYLRLPVLDVVKVESVRVRNSISPVQTLSTSDGALLTLSASVGYAIADLAKIYGSLEHAEDTIVQVTQGVIAAAPLGHIDRTSGEVDRALWALVGRTPEQALAALGGIRRQGETE